MQILWTLIIADYCTVCGTSFVSGYRHLKLITDSYGLLVTLPQFMPI
jgi:hypothetical protein